MICTGDTTLTPTFLAPPPLPLPQQLQQQLVVVVVVVVGGGRSLWLWFANCAILALVVLHTRSESIHNDSNLVCIRPVALSNRKSA